MPFAFAIIGIVFVIAGVRGTSDCLLGLLKHDLTDENNFIAWVLAIGVIGALGYVDAFRPISRAFLVLIIIVLVLAEDKKTSGGFFAKLQDQMDELTGLKGAA